MANAQSVTTMTPRISTADWSDIRKTTIAAHEAPALFLSVAEGSEMGEDHEDFEDEGGVPVSAYSSPLALWEMKTGRYRDVSNGKRGLWSRIKYGVINSACEDRAIETRRPEGVYLHPQHDFMSSRFDMEGTPDGGTTWLPIISYNIAGTLADTWRNAVGEWTPPEHVILEAQHHMACTNADSVYVIALFGGVSVRFFTIDRDEDLIQDLVETVVAFWDAVEQDRRPAHSGGRDAQVLSRLCSKIDPNCAVEDLRNDHEFIALLEKKSAKAAEKTKLEKEIKELSAQISARMDGIGSAIIGDNKQLAWSFTEEKEISFLRPASSRLIAKKISDKAAGTKLVDLIET
jgi:predicted phage-related endonuclease